MRLALTAAAGRPPVEVWHRDSELPEVDLIVLPGGFSYGDYLRAGAMAARSPVMAEVIRHAEKGVPVLGVCNGFQVLTETGLLPGALMRNTIGSLADNGQNAFRYCTPEGERAAAANPNGSRDAVAGIFNRGRTVLGMMPHPENVTDDAVGGIDGRPLFDGLAAALA